MNLLAILGLAWLALIAAQVSPGPNLAAVATVGLANGRRDALFVVSGIASGMLLWSAATALGLGALIEATPLSLFALKILGGCYLLFLGLKSARTIARDHAGLIATDGKAPTRGLMAWRQGLIVVLTNPKAALIWAAVASFVLGHGLTALHVVVLGPLAAISGMLIYGAYAWIFSTDVAKSGYARFESWIAGAFAAAFGAMGTSLLFSAIRDARG